MSKFLKVERWFDKTSTGTLRKKRVGSKAEIQFPRPLRIMYQRQGLNALVIHIQIKHNSDLADAWYRVQRMFND